jgi:hypothetical protein
MKRKTLILFCIGLLLFSISCSNNFNGNQSSSNTEYSTINEDNESKNDGYKNGIYCSEVEYYNPSTGTRNTYYLDAEVENGELIKIHWSNGGRLDETHFNFEDITSGECKFTSDKGYQFTVNLKEFGGCSYTDAVAFQKDFKKDEYISSNDLSGWQFVERTNLQTAEGDNVISGTISGGYIFKSLSGNFYKASPLTVQVVVAVMPNAEIYTNGYEYKLIIEDFDEPVVCTKLK